MTRVEDQRSVGREELELRERVDAVAKLLTEMIDGPRRHPPDQTAPAARRALIDLRPPLEKALEALGDIERRRDLTGREEDLRQAFEMLLAARRR